MTRQVIYQSGGGLSEPARPSAPATAVRLAQEAALSDPGRVYVVGELVAHREVKRWLTASYGLKFVSEVAMVPAGATLVIGVAGGAPAVLAAARHQGLHLVDGTAASLRVQQEVITTSLAADQRLVYVALSKTSPEVRTLVPKGERRIKVVTPAELANWETNHPDRTLVLGSPFVASPALTATLARLRKKYPALTISATPDESLAVAQSRLNDLAAHVEGLVIVGEPAASLTHSLVALAPATHQPTVSVVEASELAGVDWLAGMSRVGVLAGPETPDWVAAAVVANLQS